MASAPPGWYVHPHTGTWCWWDGVRWHTAVPTPPPAPQVVRAPRPPRRGRGPLVVAVLVVLALVAGAAAGVAVMWPRDGSGTTHTATPASTTTSGRVEPSTVPQVISELERFWSRARVPGLRYRAIDPSAVYDDPSQVSSCGDQPLTQQALVDNAFFCVPDDYVYYDPGFVQQLGTEVGPLVPAVVLAHEWGHRIQSLSDSFPATSLATELQADCYAGAWARSEVADGRIAAGDDPLLELFRTAVLIGDHVELQSGDAAAHGTGFDRAGAIVTGWREGVDACVQLGQDPPATVQGSTLGSGISGDGDLPFEDLVPVAVDMLNASYPGKDLSDSDLVSSCKGSAGTTGTRACGDGTMVVDQDQLATLYRRYGDMAAWAPIVAAYLDSVGGPGKEGGPHDCGVGALAGSMLGRGLYSPTVDDSISLSGGDLDELLLQLGQGNSGRTAFARIDDVRRGFEGGWTACR